jgi:flagellar protein FlaG
MKVAEVSAIAAVGQQQTQPDPQVRQEVQDRRALLAAVKELDLPELSLPNRSIDISYDREARQSVVKIVDGETGEVVKQIPGKDVLERAKFYRELSGL